MGDKKEGRRREVGTERVGGSERDGQKEWKEGGCEGGRESCVYFNGESECYVILGVGSNCNLELRMFNLIGFNTVSLIYSCGSHVVSTLCAWHSKGE